MKFPTAATIWGGFTKRRAIAVALSLAGLAAILTYADWWGAVLVFPCFWILFLVPSLPVCLAAWFLGRRRVQWTKWTS